jgi:hypothetical protein
MVVVRILWRRQTEHYPRFGPTEEDAHSCHKGPWRHAPQGEFDVLLTNTHRCWCMLCNHNRRCRSVRHCFIVTCDKQVYVQDLAAPEWLQTAAALGKVHNLLLVTSAGLSEGHQLLAWPFSLVNCGDLQTWGSTAGETSVGCVQTCCCCCGHSGVLPVSAPCLTSSASLAKGLACQASVTELRYAASLWRSKVSEWV